MQDISPKDFFRISSDGKSIIIDVRTHPEFSSGHIKDSINIDISSKDFVERIESLDREKTYLLYCRSGSRSSYAMQIMGQKRFLRVFNLKEGIIGWKREGFPLS